MAYVLPFGFVSGVFRGLLTTSARDDSFFTPGRILSPPTCPATPPFVVLKAPSVALFSSGPLTSFCVRDEPEIPGLDRHRTLSPHRSRPASSNRGGHLWSLRLNASIGTWKNHPKSQDTHGHLLRPHRWARNDPAARIFSYLHSAEEIIANRAYCPWSWHRPHTTAPASCAGAGNHLETNAGS